MDPLTHALSSLTLQRGFFPRATWRSTLAIIVAGTIADLDWFAASLGPAGYLRWHRTATHSLVFIAGLVLLAAIFKRIVRSKESSANWIGLSWFAIAASGTLHILMDSLQASAVTPLWPFSARRFSFDLLPTTDPWLLVILVASILFPELIRLIGDEIGSRNKSPRGRNGAVAGFVLILLFVILRGALHSNVIAYLDARSIAGETPRRVAAFPDSLSPFLWHSIVETDSTLSLQTVRCTGGEVTDATGVTTLHKPEPSPILAAAQSSPAALVFLKLARFPKATTQKETEGFSAEIADVKDLSMEEKDRAIVADINLDKSGAVVSSELQWRDSKKP